jgi:Methylamine utilisation protein MauE
MSLITQLAGFLVALVFGWGAIAKLVRFSQWQHALGSYRLPRLIGRAASMLVPLAELAVAGLFVTDHALAGAALTVALLAVFSLALLSARQIQGNRLPCGCFGRATPHDYRLLVARNGALACLAAVVLIDGRNHLFTDAIRPNSTTLLPAALVVLGLSMALWMGREIAEAMRKR